jgi:integrase/recombinase XerD
MEKLKMTATKTLTFQEGCEKYLEYCRQRNLREGTINHYKQSYTQFYKFFDPDTPIEEFDEDAYKNYVLHLKAIRKNILQSLHRCSDTQADAAPEF